MSRKRNNRRRGAQQSKRPAPKPTHDVMEAPKTAQADATDVETEETVVTPVVTEEEAVPEEVSDLQEVEEEVAPPSAEDPEELSAVTESHEVPEEAPEEPEVLEEANTALDDEDDPYVETFDDVEDFSEETFEEEPDQEESEEDDLSLAPSGFEEDDEEYLGSDEVIHDEDSLAIVKQIDGVVSWEIVNFYRENGKVPNKWVLRGNPPVFKISSGDGAAAEFLVTRELSAQLSRIFGDVNKAYFGIDPTVKKKNIGQASLKNRMDGAVEWVKDNPIKSLVGLLLLVLVILSPFLY